jgi:uncharacterized protein
MYNKLLIIQGLASVGSEHWQGQWEARYGYERVLQHDWERPLRGDWITRLEEVVLAEPAATPIYLVAQGLGCILVAAWAGVSRNTQRVHGALLVAPQDIERTDLRERLPSWSPPAHQPKPRQHSPSDPLPREVLPFPSQLLACPNDPSCSFDRAQGLAQTWGSEFVDASKHGYRSGDGNLGAWPEGHALLLKLQQRSKKTEH